MVEENSDLLGGCKMKAYKHLLYLFSAAGLLTVITLAFSNCGNVKFGSTSPSNKTGNDVLTVDPGNGGLGDGDPTDEPPGGDPPGGDPPGGDPPVTYDCDAHRPYCEDRDDHSGGHEHSRCDRDKSYNHSRHQSSYSKLNSVLSRMSYNSDDSDDYNCEDYKKYCEDEDDDDDDDGHDGRTCHGDKNGCKFNGIKDIIVNIARIEIRGTHGEVLVITGDLGETSILGGELPIFVAQNIDAVGIRLVLADGGNVLIDNDNKSFDLKTPSGQESGLKIPFRGNTKLKGPGAYMLKFSIDAETQVVHPGKKCLLKPVLKFVSILPI